MIKKTTLLFVLLSFIASALNYCMYPLFSRLLAPMEYVSITASLSLFTQMSAFLSSILAITIGLSKSEKSESSHAKIELLQAFLFKLFLVIAALFLIFSPSIMGVIHTPAIFAVPICIMMLLSIPIQIISGYLNGKNLMVKLGSVALMTAGSQFVLGLITALVSQNGFATILAMSGAQIITLAIIFTAFSKDNLPNIGKSLKTPLLSIQKQGMGGLILYTALTSFAIMAISLIQILDLFIVQNLINADVKFYTDMYVISRVVFFAGTIFIWPFLGEISLDHHHFNRKPFLRLLAIFTGISALAIVALVFFGAQLSSLLFGAQYAPQTVSIVGTLSVLYKFFMLIITAVTLYLIVLQRYAAVVLAFFASAAFFGYAQLANKSANLQDTLLWLTGIALFFAIVSTILLFKTPVKKQSS